MFRVNKGRCKVEWATAARKPNQHSSTAQGGRVLYKRLGNKYFTFKTIASGHKCPFITLNTSSPVTLWYARKALICTKLIQLHITTHVIGLPKIETYSRPGHGGSGSLQWHFLLLLYFLLPLYFLSQCGELHSVTWREFGLNEGLLWH